jgi:general secretion pathway protein D
MVLLLFLFVGAALPVHAQVKATPQVTGVQDPTVSRDDVQETIMPGTQNFVGYRGAAARGMTGGDVTLNYPNVDVHDAAKAILGDLLGLNYAVDQAVTGTVTVSTANPVARSQVLQIFESALKNANMALVRQGGIYTIVPLAAAQKTPSLVSPGDYGFGTEAIQLHFVNATDLKKLIDPMTPEADATRADPGRNMLLVTGTGAERSAIRDLIRRFDVDWMRGMSFALFVPKNSDSRSLVAELDAMINQQGSPAASVVRLLSLDRLNAVLAITAEPRYLTEIRKWVGVLDKLGAQGEKRLYVYRVQNSRAADLAKSLATAFGASGGGSGTNGTSGTAQRNPALQTTAAVSSAPSNSTTMGGNNTSTSGNSPFSSPTSFDEEASPNAPAEQSAVSQGQTVQIGNNEGTVTISSDDNNNAILVYATARQYGIVQDALAKLDLQPLQVLIEAAIAEVTLTNNLNYGVQWYFAKGGSQIALSQGTTSTPVQNFPGFSFMYANNNNTINAVLNELSDITTVKVVSAPKLLVLNNHTASLEVGDQVPISTESSVSTTTSDAPVVNSIEYRDTGVILKVTPRVNDSGLILLDIAQEVSNVASPTTPTNNAAGINSPTISQRKVSSSVAVQDNETIALGGLITDNVKQENTGLPFFNQIPILGSLFGSYDHERTRTELVVLLTPRVVRGRAEADSVTDEFEKKFPAVKPIILKGKY